MSEFFHKQPDNTDDHWKDNLETASLPTTTPEERKRLLSFVVCGGGPTGVEFAAELADMMSEDVLNYVRCLLKQCENESDGRAVPQAPP